MTTPLLTPPAAPSAIHDHEPEPATESLARPYRLGLAGLGALLGLFVRLLAANGIGELESSAVMLGAALTSAVMGLGLLLMAAERDRFGPALAWISIITALAWGALSWISPPFAESVTVWSNPDQVVMAALGVGNGLLLAGIVALAFVRRHPTMTVAATLLAGVLALASNSVVLRNEWPAILLVGAAFALILLAWDQSPRKELVFTRPEDPPRVSRAVLSFVSVALCGTAIQLWTSRTDIPRSIPAVALCVVLLIGAFASLIRVRREIEQRETTLSEWTSWVREIRKSDFRAEMQNFDADGPDAANVDEPPTTGVDGEAPRKLSFPGLAYADRDSIEEALQPEPSLPEPSLPEPSLPEPSTPMPAFDLPRPDTAAPDPIQIPHIEPVAVPAPDPAPITISEPAPIPEPLPEAEPVPAVAAVAQTQGAFSSLLNEPEPAAATSFAADSPVTDLTALAAWLGAPNAAERVKPLLVAVEAMSLDEFESLPPSDAAMATEEIGSFLAETLPDADLVSWIDGPYFIVALASRTDAELLGLNKDVLKSLKATDGTLALVRPTLNADLEDVVNDCVIGLLHARLAKDRAAGR